MRAVSRWIVTALLVAASGLDGAPSGRTPAWVQAAVAAPLSEQSAGTAAVVLLDEGLVEIRADGQRIERMRMVVRVLTRDGRTKATASAWYTKGSEKIESASAWLIRPSGAVRAYARKEFTDRASYEGELYSEARQLVLPAAQEAEPGSVFAWEIVRSGREVFSTGLWWFGGQHPVEASRLTVRLPAGWRIEGRIFNHEGATPRVEGLDTSWELRRLAPFVAEPWGVSSGAVVPVLAYNIFPSPQAASRVPLRPFATWGDVSEFLADLGDPMVVVDASIQARAEELTRGIDDEHGRIAAIARHVQRVNYVSIARRLGTGGGYTPHPAPQVLRTNFGDCKDKANLMRALLRAIGIDSHYVAVSVDPPPVVWPEWPSPSQFNHAIIAVRVSEAVESPAIVQDPELGRLLFFDPTSTATCFGDLPADYQGSKALVVARGKGRLVDIPAFPPAASVLHRNITAALSAEGAVRGRLHERSTGQQGAEERMLFRQASPSDYARTIQAWVAGGVRGARVEDVVPTDDPVAGTFTLEARFEAASYAQLLRNRMLVLKPVMLSRRSFTPLTAAARVHPIWIRGRSTSESVEIELPQGYRVSETGEAVSLRESFGDYDLRIEVGDGRLRLERTLVLRPGVVPAADYARVREFFARIIRAEQQPCVLELEPKPVE